jgi:Host cell surface-exposed lipoprotein
MGFIKRRWAGWNKAQRIGWSAITIFVALVAIVALASPSETPSTSVASNETVTVTETETTPDPVEEEQDIINEAIEETPVAPSTPSETSGQENARESAESYLRSSAFSRKSLINQLLYEGFSRADATYAVDNVVVNWNEQAALSAEAYLRSSSFSRSSLMEQLLYEGFTQAQAGYGVSAAY